MVILYVISLFTKLNKNLSAVDVGSNTHVLGNTWKPLYPVTNNDPRTDVIGFEIITCIKKAYQLVHISLKLLHQLEGKLSQGPNI